MSLEESVSFLKTYNASLKKDIKAKDVEIGKLKAYIEELEAEKRLAKGERRELKKQSIIKEYIKKLTDAKAQNDRLKKDREDLIYKLNQNALLSKPQQ
jgi:predicted RNase H-like nuclease (RuvC/YqgF family)